MPDEVKNNKFSDETAAAEFFSYCEANDLDHDEAGMNEEDLKSFLTIKKRFIKACKQGRVVVDDTNILYINSDRSPQGYSGEQVKITRPKGSAFSGMDGNKDTQTIRRLHGFCSAMTGKDISYFTYLDIIDWYFYRDIATLFLAE